MIEQKLSDLKLLILDVDGTLTDGGVYITEKGEQMKKFNAKDGIAIQRIISSGIHVGIISHSKSSGMVEKRAEMLGIDLLYVGSAPKTEILENWLKDLNLSAEQVCFIGDDINDMEIMKMVEIAVCPADADSEIKFISDLVLEKKGGDACIREFYDRFLR